MNTSSSSRSITYNSNRNPSSKAGYSSYTFYLATVHNQVQFYLFDEPLEGGVNSFSLIQTLDTSRLLGAGNKDTAKIWAKRLGLKTFRYVRI